MVDDPWNWKINNMDANSHDKYKPEWGFHNLMVLAAFRYCLSRSSYIVPCCTEWLVKWWPEIDHHTKLIILREIKEALDKRIIEFRCDIDSWKKVLDLEMDK